LEIDVMSVSFSHVAWQRFAKVKLGNACCTEPANCFIYLNIIM